MFSKKVNVLLSVFVVINFAAITPVPAEQPILEGNHFPIIFENLNEALEKEFSSELIEDFKKLPEYEQGNSPQAVMFIVKFKKVINAELLRHKEVNADVMFELIQAVRYWAIDRKFLNQISTLAAKLRTKKISDEDFRNEFKKLLTAELNFYITAYENTLNPKYE